MNSNIGDGNTIKQDLRKTVRGLLTDRLEDKNSSVIFDKNYVGKVVDNNDPEKLGRCKILVYGVFSEGIPNDALPWAIPEFSFIGSKKGSFIVPTIDTIVKVEFENDEINLPRYSSKVLNREQLPTRKDVNYPDNMIFFETDKGDSFEIDRSTGEVKFTHNKGTKITIDSDGTLNIHSESDLNITHTKTLFVDGNKVVPEGIGPLCALPFCAFNGAAHTGRTCSPTVVPPLTLSEIDAINAQIDESSEDEGIDGVLLADGTVVSGGN